MIQYTNRQSVNVVGKADDVGCKIWGGNSCKRGEK
jgi:hypothetical protein